LSVSVCPHIPIPFSNPHFLNPLPFPLKKYKNRSRNRVFPSAFVRFHPYTAQEARPVGLLTGAAGKKERRRSASVLASAKLLGERTIA
jgi:hypothetical protein